MKQVSNVWVRRAVVLVLLLCTPLSSAQQQSDEAALQQARAAVTQALGQPSAGLAFAGLRLVQDKLGALVCGTVNGKRFLAGPAGKPPPQIEGAMDAAMFNYLWNARCRGMSASAAEERFRREQK